MSVVWAATRDHVISKGLAAAEGHADLSGLLYLPRPWGHLDMLLLGVMSRSVLMPQACVTTKKYAEVLGLRLPVEVLC